MTEGLSMAEQIAASESGNNVNAPVIETQVQSSLNTETTNVVNNDTQSPPATTEAAVETTTPETTQVETTTTTTEPIKTFAQQLEEVSGGKFKDWKELEPLLTPREEYDEEIRHLAELKKQGVKFDKEFWELQTKDYTQMSDPFEIIKESMRKNPEFDGLSDNVLEHLINDKYKINDWSEEGEEPTEIETIQAELMKRDALRERQKLVEYKNARTLSKKPNEDQLRQQAELDRSAQLNWESFVDNELAGKINKLSVVLDDKSNSTFDFEYPQADKLEVANRMKEMTKDINVFWNQFDNGNGEIDQKKVFEVMLFLKNRDAIIKTAHQNAVAAGREAEVKTIKNIDFTPEGGKSTNSGETLAGNILKSMGL
jgi:hypothetical protein